MSNEDPSQVDEHLYDLRVRGSFKIGRSNLCNIILKDGHVSKVHCSLNICGGKDDPSSSSSAGSKCQVLISDHSSNGTWISSSNGETIKLEKGKPTLLKEDDVIFLTRSTAANSNVIAYKYCPSPFPRITKFMYKPEQPKLRQSNARMLGCQAGKTEKDDKIVRIPVKRKHKADGPGISDRKVRFKETIEESVSNNTTLFESPVTNAEQGTESLDGRIDYASFSVTGKISCAVKESNHALESTSTLGNDKTTAFDGVEGVTHTPISASAHTVSTPSSTDSQSEFSKVLKSNEKRGSPLEEEVPNCDAFVQTSVTSGFNVPEDGGHHNMCTQCGKWIPHVTMSSHEAVCEGQSQEAKIQDHISLSSVPLKSITHTPVSASSHISTPSSTELGRSELSKALTWKSNEKLDSPLEEEVANCDAFVQTSGFNAPEDGGHHDKCTQCGKWIPHVTLSLHEAVCEGQSHELKVKITFPYHRFHLKVAYSERKGNLRFIVRGNR
ncbi:hypothetical protein OS493_035611 [Desmophyllum pertusum]|uniref:FHA domain-containing protein n=1 Tax=Desmophyllum pertusum TaxID=174260 RepID=A0A9X0D2E0_9CNID|nr:hypothetical protein OS493_035611 [Desmophyllum pertusum]